MTKKDYILTLLTKLDGIRDMAGPLKTLIEHTDIDNEFINWLAEMLLEAVNEVDNNIQKKKLEAGQLFLKNLQQKESDESVDLDAELDTMLASL